MPDVRLGGCRLTPISGYLKALAVLRLVCSQSDRHVRGWWEGDTFVIRSELSEDELVRFFLEQYVPTPVVAPWNADSGFYAERRPSGPRAVAAIEQSQLPRLEPYRKTIRAARERLAAGNHREPPKEAAKADLIEDLRSFLPDDALPWLDACVLLTGNGPSYPPLLGSGGNDGSADFTKNQMQRLAEIMISPKQPIEHLLRASLCGHASPHATRDIAIGQFSPAHSGGDNAGMGGARDSLVNPWDYVLLIEGATCFAAAATRRMAESGPGSLSYPFMVRAMPVGLPSSTPAEIEKSRHELWLPVWQSPSTFPELSALLGEGRAQLGRHTVETPTEFALALSRAGISRGVAGFARYAFHQRNGKSYFAVPAGVLHVRERPKEALADNALFWLNRVRALPDRSDRLSRAVRSCEQALYSLAANDTPEEVQGALSALTQVERAVSLLPVVARGSVLPLTALSAAWRHAADDGSVEFRLAASLASLDLRPYLLPVTEGRFARWEKSTVRVVVQPGRLVESLLAILHRRALEAEPSGSEARGRPVPVLPADLAAFLLGATDDARTESLLRGCLAVEPNVGDVHRGSDLGDARPLPALFGLLALASSREPLRGVVLPPTPGLLAAAALGDSLRATSLAVRRLRGAGLVPLAPAHAADRRLTRRAAAALAFPLADATRHALARKLLRSVPEPHEELTA